MRLVEQPSISATGEGVSKSTELIVELCQAYGFDDTYTVEMDGQPAVIEHAESADPTTPMILIYGHYDVQPVSAEKWTTPPFEAFIRDGPDGRPRLYARGAGDNKGQWFAHSCAVHALRKTTGPPTNITLLLEGEEASGSPTLHAVVRKHSDDLAGDFVYVADGPVDASGRPHVLTGARGMLYVELIAEGPNRDLHSGNYGGPVPNSAWELIHILSSMKDETGRITIDGYYNAVRPITDLDRKTLNPIPFDAESVKNDLDIDGFTTKSDNSYLEQHLYHPTLNIGGFTSGYGGKGMKTIIPSTAQAKLDMRLVADQDPDNIYEKFRTHVSNYESGTVDVSVQCLGTMDSHRTPLDHPIVDLVLDAVSTGWNANPILKPTLGGSLPSAVFADVVDLPVVTVPYANADENNHSPDENLALNCFDAGIRTTIALLRATASD